MSRPVEADRARARAAHPRDGLDELLLAVAVDARDADDLARPHVEREPAHGLEAAVVHDVQVLHLQRELAGRRGLLVHHQQHLAADHELGQALLGGARDGHRGHLLAAAQHRHAVGDSQHLVELVGDDDDRGAGGLELAQHAEQLLRLLRRQHRGRLVEDQHLRVAVQRLQDLDALLLADGQVLDPGLRRDGEPVAPRQLAHALLGGRHVDGDALSRLGGEHDVLGHRHHRDQHEVLVHHADLRVDGVRRRAEVHGLAVEHDLARVGPVQPVQAVHQGRLAGPVLAQQGVDLAGAHVEVDRVVRDDAREGLGDAPELEHRGARAPGVRTRWGVRVQCYGTSVGISTVPALMASACASTASRASCGTSGETVPRPTAPSATPNEASWPPVKLPSATDLIAP